MSRIYGGGENDQLPAARKLGSLLRPLVETGPHQPGEGLHTGAIAEAKGGLVLKGTVDGGATEMGAVDEVIVCTGQRHSP